MVSHSPRAAKLPGNSHPQLSGFDRWFEITRRGATLGNEVRGGLVTFFTMAYIIALNPLIIGTTADVNGNLISGQPRLDAAGEVIGANVGASIGMVAAATALIAAIMTILMGVVGRYPLGLAAGLGINALIAYVIAPRMTWPQAMGLIVWEGILITVLVLTGFRTAVFKSVPRALRTAISVGIGLFIAFVGLIDAGVVRKPAGSPPVELGINGNLLGWPIFIFLFGFLLVIALYVRKVRGAMLIAIAVTTVIAVVVEAIFHLGPRSSLTNPNPQGWSLNVPSLTGGLFQVPDLSLIGKVDLFGAFTGGPTVIIGVVLTIFALMLADFFDTVGTVVAIGTEGNLLDKSGNPPHLQEILLVDSIAAMGGGFGSVSSNTSFIESASGVGEGARTGLASVVTGLGFLVAVLFSPLVNVVPSEAVAPVLFFVGFLMMQQVTEIDWTDLEDAIPAFVTIVLMPFTYSITNGIGAGFTLWVFIKLFRGKGRQIHPLLYVVTALFLLYFGQGLIDAVLRHI